MPQSPKFGKSPRAAIAGDLLSVEAYFINIQMFNYSYVSYEVLLTKLDRFATTQRGPPGFRFLSQAFQAF